HVGWRIFLYRNLAGCPHKFARLAPHLLARFARMDWCRALPGSSRVGWANLAREAGCRPATFLAARCRLARLRGPNAGSPPCTRAHSTPAYRMVKRLVYLENRPFARAYLRIDDHNRPKTG